MSSQGPIIQCTTECGYYVLHIPGAYRWAEDETAALDSSIRRIAAEVEAPRVAVSLKDAKLVSTATFGKLMVLQREISSQGGRLALVDVGENVMEALENMKIAKLLNVSDTVEHLAEDEDEATEGEIGWIEEAEDDEEGEGHDEGTG